MANQNPVDLKYGKTKSIKAPVYILLIIFCILPGLYFSYVSVQEPWTEFRVARAAASIANGSLVDYITSASGYRIEHLGGELIYVALIQTTSFPLEWIVLLPIGSIILAILYFGISLQVFRSLWSAAAITVFASWYYPRLVSQYGTNTYAWTNALFLSFLILLWSRLDFNKPVITTSILVIFTATFLHYHTTPIWIIVILAVSMGSTYIVKRKGLGPSNVITWALPASCIVLYLTFDSVSYGNALGRISTELGDKNFLLSLFNRVITPLFQSAPNELLPFEVVSVNPQIAIWTTFIVLILLVVPVAIWCSTRLIRAITERNLAQLISSKERIFIWALVLAAASHLVMYSLIGAFSTRVVPLAFPLILPLVLADLNISPKVETILASLLGVLAIIGFISYSSNLKKDTLSSELGNASKLLGNGSRILSDADTYGSILFNAIEEGDVVDLEWVDSKNYASALGKVRTKKPDYQYLVVEKSNNPVMSIDWSEFEPWLNHIDEINWNPELSRVYENESIILFMSQSAELSVDEAELTSNNADFYEKNYFVNVIRSTMAVIFLCFAPGAIFVIAGRLYLIDGIRETPTLAGLSIGLSISLVTILSYIVNFSPLNLRMLMPFVYLIPPLAFIAYLSVYKLSLSSVKENYRIILSIMIVSVLFAASATAVAVKRTEQHLEYTEFFLTSVDNTGATINIINRNIDTKEYYLQIVIDEEIKESIGPILLQSNGADVNVLPYPKDFDGEKLTIHLYEEGKVSKELHYWDSPDDSVGS